MSTATFPLTLRKIANRQFSAECYFNNQKVVGEIAGRKKSAIKALEEKITSMGHQGGFPDWNVTEVDGAPQQSAPSASSPFAAPQNAAPQAAPQKPAKDKRDPEPFTFKAGPAFGLGVLDGLCGATSQNPPTENTIAVHAVVPHLGIDEVRIYQAGAKGWVRNKKNTGWNSYFPKRVG